MDLPTHRGSQLATSSATAVFSSPYRRRRIFFTLALFATLFLLFGGPSSLFTAIRNPLARGTRHVAVRAREIHGLLHLVTASDRVLPSDLDVSKPLDMRVYSPEGDEWAYYVERVHAEHPVIVFSKTYCPYSKKAKVLLQSYDLNPPPKIIEVDTREDGPQLKSLLTRLSHRATFPNVFLLDDSLGGSDDLERMHATGELRARFEQAGLDVQGNVGFGAAAGGLV